MAIGNWLAPTPVTSMRIWPLATPERRPANSKKVRRNNNLLIG
jgi:hypothetical protein